MINLKYLAIYLKKKSIDFQNAHNTYKICKNSKHASSYPHDENPFVKIIFFNNKAVNILFTKSI